MIGLTAASSRLMATNGIEWAIVDAVHSRAARRSERSSARRRQLTLASSGSAAPGSAGAAVTVAVSASGDRAAHDHERGFERQLAHLLGVTLTLRHDGE